ncbi:MAG: hypothetical protein MIO93_17030, partial [ANME-2 cluster archaeon]|nr:hypothetical protein [ANME-2 cluster archaeon]
MHPFIKFLTTAILILVLLSAGCTDTGDGSGSNPIPAETDTSYPIDDSAQTEDITQEQTPEVKPTEAEKIINHPFDISNPHIDYINIDSSENLFGIDIDEGYKFSNDVNGNYDFYNSDKNMIFQHLEHPHFDLYSELQPEQARALEDQYGNMKSVVMEQ